MSYHKPDAKCVTKWCRGNKAEKKTFYTRQDGSRGYSESRLNLCWKCRSRKLKKERPATYVLNMIRHSARKRGIPFDLTVDEFEGFCAQTAYLSGRGNKKGNLTVDRIDRRQGYSLNNIRVLSHAENSMQGTDNTPRRENCPF